MNLDKIASAYGIFSRKLQPAKKAVSTEPARPVPARPAEDKVEISPDIEKKKIDLIRKRIANGYYVSPDIDDDLTDKLSRVFDSLE